MDASLQPSLYLIPEWNLRLIDDYEDEVDTTDSWSMKLLEEEGRKAVWNMCSSLSVDTNGVPAHACRLLERYLFRNMLNLRGREGDIDWEVYKRNLASRIPLLMASCVQLAAKMSSAAMQVNAFLVRACLLCKGVVFSVSDIIKSEFQVFSTLGYCVPLWTSLETAQMLAVQAHLPLSAMEGVAVVLNIAEYRRDRLTARVRGIANLLTATDFNPGSLSSLHLAAGAVAASARYLSCAVPDPVPRLAQLTRAPCHYVKCISDVILADLLVDDTEVKDRLDAARPRKRKMTPLQF